MIILYHKTKIMPHHMKNKLPENCIDHVASTMSKGNFCKPHILQFFTTMDLEN